MSATKLRSPSEVRADSPDLGLEDTPRLRGKKIRVAVHCFYSLCGLAVFTWLAFQFKFNLPSAGFSYLIVVVLSAEYAGFLAATVTSVVAVVCLAYFFEAPIFAFGVGERADWLVFAAFEFTALVISRLALRAQLK